MENVAVCHFALVTLIEWSIPKTRVIFLYPYGSSISTKFNIGFCFEVYFDAIAIFINYVCLDIGTEGFVVQRSVSTTKNPPYKLPELEQHLPLPKFKDLTF
jgi:hypothetical protein